MPFTTQHTPISKYHSDVTLRFKLPLPSDLWLRIQHTAYFTAVLQVVSTLCCTELEPQRRSSEVPPRHPQCLRVA